MGSRLVKWPDQESWKQHGVGQGYEERNSTSLKNSKDSDERSWYSKGNKNKWSQKFSFTKKNISEYQTFEQWKQHGLDQDYNQKNPKSLQYSKDPDEKLWYNRGTAKKWNPDFPFTKKHVYRWTDQETWTQHGLDQGYDQRNPASLSESKKKEETAWYSAGSKKRKDSPQRWRKSFLFNRVKSEWPDQETWTQHGLDQGYDQRSSNSLRESKDPKERAWLNRGNTGKWNPDFPFTKKQVYSWTDQETWTQHGLDQGYDQRNPASLSESKKKEERIWYCKGGREKWNPHFPFTRINGLKIHSEEQLQDFLEENEQAKKIASLSNANEYVGDVATILMKLFPKRFPSQANLAKMLPKAIQKITHALSPYSLGHIMSDFDFLPPMEIEIKRNLENLLFMIVKDQYKVKFNINPLETIEEIRQFPSENKTTKSLVGKVLTHYENVYNFVIPGFGKIRGR